jgi:hypothetical protein
MCGMKKKIKILVVVLFFSFLKSHAQSIKVSGFVKDTVGVGLDMANVIAFNIRTNAMENYAITSPQGKYKFNLPVNEVYELKVSYIGFDTKSVKLNLTNVKSDVQKNIELKASVDVLNEVEISYEMPITIKGDTIVYNSDSFRNGTEKKLEDVLEKLPGVEVNDDGEVEVEGKRVTKVMVEGKDFFDGDSKIAVQNIPADALDKIEVLRNYNEVSQMKGVTNNEDNVALNIRLKKGKEKFWFGEVTAGAGLDERYLVHPKIFYYSPKTSVNLLTDANNIGQVPFTTRDYYRFTGGFRNLSSRGGTSLNVGTNSIGLSTLQNNRANDIKTKFGASNFSYKPNDNFLFSGFGIYSGTETEMLQNSTKVFGSGLTEKISNTNTQETSLSLLKLSTKYKPSADYQLDYDVFFKLSKQEEGSGVMSISNGVNNEINTFKTDSPYSFNQNLNLYKTINAKNILAIEAQYLYQKEKPLNNSISDVLNISDAFNGVLNETQNNFDLTQLKTTKTGKLDVKLNYYYLLNDKSHLNFTLGALYSNQSFDSSIFQLLDNESKVELNEAKFTNDVTYSFADVFTGMHYKFIKGKFTAEPGLKLHFYKTTDTQLATSNTANLIRLLPDLYLNYQFKKTENLRFNYAMTNQFTDINRLSEGLLFNNYNSVYNGNRNLESSIYHRYSLNYFSFVMYNYTNINASVTYTKKENAIKNSVTQKGIGQNSTSINSNMPDETLSANFRYGRTFKKIKVSLNSRGEYSKFYNFRNKISLPNEVNLSVNEVYSYSYGGNIGTNFNKAPNIKVGFTQAINDYGNQLFYTNKPKIGVDALFLNNFIFNADYTYFDYHSKDKTITNEYAFLSAGISFRKSDSKWEYKLSGTNLLDTKSINRDSFSQVANSITTTNYYVQPRFLMFTVKYNL